MYVILWNIEMHKNFIILKKICLGKKLVSRTDYKLENKLFSSRLKKKNKR